MKTYVVVGLGRFGQSIAAACVSWGTRCLPWIRTRNMSSRFPTL